MAKYSVDYCCGSTGYGWSKDFDTIDEVESFVDEHRNVCSAVIRVYDNQINQTIFWKRCGTFKPCVDFLDDFLRDLRTTTRKCKVKGVV